MLEYISLKDLSGRYLDIKYAYENDLEQLETIKDITKSDVNSLFRNNGLKVSDVVRKTSIKLDEFFEPNEQYRLLIETTEDTALTIFFSYNGVDIDYSKDYIIVANTKTSIFLDEENYYKISSNTSTVKLFKIDDVVYQIYFYKTLSNIATSGTLSNDSENDIWGNRARQIDKDIDKLLNSIFVYDANSDGEVSEGDTEEAQFFATGSFQR